MSKGYIETTKPVANDLVYGEIIAYFNYGLPIQQNVGGITDGLKITLERSIRKIAFDGAYGAVKGLRRYEKFLPKVEINTLGLRYYAYDVISNCENDSNNTWESQDWGGNGGTYAADTTYFAKGLQSSKMTADSANYGIHEVFSASKDLTSFNNGDSSSVSDYIGFSIYISTQDLTDLGTADLRVSFHMDAEGTKTNFYSYDIAASSLTADTWNDFKILKSAFTENGTGDWSAVLGVSMELDAAPNDEVVCYIDDICLIQAAEGTTIVPQKGWGGEWDYVDQGDYKEYTPSLSIQPNDYLENLTLIGQKHDGKYWKYILKKCLNDNELSMALEEKKEAISNLEFSSHYIDGNIVPIEIHEEV